MQRQMSGGDTTAMADTRECDHKAAAVPAAAAEAVTTTMGADTSGWGTGGSTGKKAKGGWGTAVETKARAHPGGWGVRKTTAERYRQVLLDKVIDAEARVTQAELDRGAASEAYDRADERWDIASAEQHRAHADRQAASSDFHRTVQDREDSIKDGGSAKDLPRRFDEEENDE